MLPPPVSATLRAIRLHSRPAGHEQPLTQRLSDKSGLLPSVVCFGCRYLVWGLILLSIGSETVNLINIHRDVSTRNKVI